MYSLPFHHSFCFHTLLHMASFHFCSFLLLLLPLISGYIIYIIFLFIFASFTHHHLSISVFIINSAFCMLLCMSFILGEPLATHPKFHQDLRKVFKNPIHPSTALTPHSLQERPASVWPRQKSLHLSLSKTLPLYLIVQACTSTSFTPVLLYHILLFFKWPSSLTGAFSFTHVLLSHILPSSK